MANAVTIDSDTQATAIWTYGLPPLGVEVVPELWFNNRSEIHIASYNDTSLNLTKQMGNATASTGVQCSFAGGCHLEVQAEGLSTLLKNDSVNNFISVCDERCEFIHNLSDSTKATCRLPKMSTVYSNEQFKIETTKEDLRFRRTFGTLNDVSVVYDHQLTVVPGSLTSYHECFVGGSFKENHVGMLE